MSCLTHPGDELGGEEARGCLGCQSLATCIINTGYVGFGFHGVLRWYGKYTKADSTQHSMQDKLSPVLTWLCHATYMILTKKAYLW